LHRLTGIYGICGENCVIEKRSEFAQFCFTLTVTTKKDSALIFDNVATLASLNVWIRIYICRGAGKSLARPGRKQTRKHVTDAHDFNSIQTRAVMKFFFSARQGAEENSHQSDRNISLFPSWSG